MGKIKEGFGSLIGNAGEYYVVAEMLKRGLIAALAPRNAPGFDILATNPLSGKTVKIRVKTKSEEYDVWQFMAKKDGRIFKFGIDEEDFTVLVNLAMDVKNLRYFIVPTQKLNDWLEECWEDWLRTPGKNGRPHSPTNPKRNLPYKKFESELLHYENHWGILWEK